MPGSQGAGEGDLSLPDQVTWQRTLRLSLADAALSTTLQTLTTGVFITGFGLALGANQVQIGILAALPTLGNVAQIMGSYFIERTGRRKSICLGATTCARALWFAILAAPFVWTAATPNSLVWGLVLLLATSSVLAAIGGVAWLSWMKELVPSRHRADFLSRRNQIGTGLALSISIAAGLFLDWWGARTNPAAAGVGGFAWIFAFAALCGLAAIPYLRATPDTPLPNPRARESFFNLIRLPIRDQNFRRLVSFYAFWNLGVNLASPFFHVYMLRELNQPFWFITLVNTLAGVASLATNQFWVQLSSRFGNKPIVFLATLGNAFFPLCWIFIDRASAWWLVPIHLLGVFNSVVVLGPNNIMFKLAPDRHASAYLAIFNAVVGPVTALAPVLGGLLATSLAAAEWQMGAVTIAGMKFVFLLSFVLRFGSLLLLHRVTEPDAQGLRSVWRTMRERTVHVPAQDGAPPVVAPERTHPSNVPGTSGAGAAATEPQPQAA